MNEDKYYGLYFDHLILFSHMDCFILPIAFNFSKSGIVISFGFWGLSWNFKRFSEEYAEEIKQAKLKGRIVE